MGEDDRGLELGELRDELGLAVCFWRCVLLQKCSNSSNPPEEIALEISEARGLDFAEGLIPTMAEVLVATEASTLEWASEVGAKIWAIDHFKCLLIETCYIFLAVTNKKENSFSSHKSKKAFPTCIPKVRACFFSTRLNPK